MMLVRASKALYGKSAATGDLYYAGVFNASS